MRMRDPQFHNRCLIYGGLALVTLAVYLPALHHGFVEYDDQQYVTDNPRVQAGLTWTGLVWAFGFHAGNWHPLAWLSHMVDCQLYGARAGGHHLTNVLLHVASTLLLFSVLNRMMGLAVTIRNRRATLHHGRQAGQPTPIYGPGRRCGAARGGGAVCVASAPRRIRGLGGRKKRRALRLFLDAHAVALRPLCRAAFHHPLSFRARLLCPLPDGKTDGSDLAIRVAAAGLLAAETIYDLRFTIYDFSTRSRKNSFPDFIARRLCADFAGAGNRDCLHRRAAGFRAHRPCAGGLQSLSGRDVCPPASGRLIIPIKSISQP